MPTFIVSLFGFIQANWSYVAQVVLLLTLFGSLLNWIAGMLAANSWTKSAQFFAGVASFVGDLVKAIGYGISLLYSLFGKTPPPMSKRMMRGPFDDWASSGIIELSKKPASPDITKKVDVPLMRFAAPFAMVFAALLCALAISCTALTPAAGPTADAVACASGYIVETGLEGVTPTLSGFETQCSKEITGLASAALETIFDLLVQSFATPSAGDGGIKQTGPNPFLSGATLLRNEYSSRLDGGK
jgi:hypothetical protein